MGLTTSSRAGAPGICARCGVPQHAYSTSCGILRGASSGPDLYTPEDIRRFLFARRLLSKIRVVSEVPEAALKTAKNMIGAHAPEDVCFLALGFDSNATAIVSRDRAAFDIRPGVKRWELGKAVQVVVDRESGAFSLVIASASIQVLGRALEWLFTGMFAILAEVVEALGTIASILLGRAVEALSRMPSWIWIVVAIVALAMLLAYIFHEGFRDWVNARGHQVLDFLSSVSRRIIANASALFAFLRDVAVMVWNLLAPAAVMTAVACGVLGRRITLLLKGFEEESTPPSA